MFFHLLECLGIPVIIILLLGSLGSLFPFWNPSGPYSSLEEVPFLECVGVPAVPCFECVGFPSGIPRAPSGVVTIPVLESLGIPRLSIVRF